MLQWKQCCNLHYCSAHNMYGRWYKLNWISLGREIEFRSCRLFIIWLHIFWQQIQCVREVFKPLVFFHILLHYSLILKSIYTQYPIMTKKMCYVCICIQTLSVGAFWQTPSGPSCAFYWGVASVWPLCNKALIGGGLQRWLSFWKVLLSPERKLGAWSEWPSGSW